MRVRADYARRLIADQECDRMVAFDERKNKIGQWSGAEEIGNALDDLLKDTAGYFVVKVWKQPTNKGRFRMEEKAFTLTLRGEAEDKVNGTNGNGSGTEGLMRELYNVRLQVAEMKLAAKYDDRTERLFEKYAPYVQDVLDRLLPDDAVNGRRSIGEPDDDVEDVEAEVVGERPRPKAPKPSPLNDELKEVLGLVIRLYKKDPDMVRRFVPAVKAQL